MLYVGFFFGGRAPRLRLASDGREEVELFTWAPTGTRLNEEEEWFERRGSEVGKLERRGDDEGEREDCHCAPGRDPGAVQVREGYCVCRPWRGANSCFSGRNTSP